MDAKTRQQVLTNISAEDLEKVKAHQAKTQGAFPVDNEWMLLAEFARAYGWQAYLDVKNESTDEHGNLLVTTEEMMTLIEANRKIEYVNMLKNAQAVFAGSGAAQSTRPSQTFRALTENIIKQTKVDI